MPFSRQETCHYIATQAAELQKLAQAVDHPVLVHLFRMVQIEADANELAEIKALRRAVSLAFGQQGLERRLAPMRRARARTVAADKPAGVVPLAQAATPAE